MSNLRIAVFIGCVALILSSTASATSTLTPTPSRSGHTATKTATGSRTGTRTGTETESATSGTATSTGTSTSPRTSTSSLTSTSTPSATPTHSWSTSTATPSRTRTITPTANTSTGTNCTCTAANATCAAKQEELNCKLNSGCLSGVNFTIECQAAKYSGHYCLNCALNSSVVDTCPPTCRFSVSTCADLQTRLRCVYDNKAKCGGTDGVAALCNAAKIASVNGSVCQALLCAASPIAFNGANALGGFIAALFGSLVLFFLA